ncbi:bifunctional class I SAM-dependent methyltransferase/glycosyltransferase family 2 protein [Synoicihabitans lomoniglobus]|uniref:Bifunctional class I SAM-dependent methyltransferase/glycosyltransferase family 2 protein n=1 Tax=Synoicihabitans lomoniglobus TaxID=2909285 RepID=A0AAF0I658_9BACT|nr:bifunctional class I SAM-dependent methyltransferase/glycosyltransferase family 2 protein [Opitutaceae bacterium LMO-M01]WED67380.1 bifunctional class I SAM-dependent methyltransferase/glycosyltransferase family 2 protein [Opitutaceae bacterium LMO-M01]
MPLSQPPTDSSQTIREHFDQFAQPLPGLARAYRRLLAHYYSLLIPVDATVLEIGCGSGELLKHIPAKRKVGVDLSIRQIELARNNVPDAVFIQSDGQSLPLDETFDYVVISDTINFVDDVQVLLSRIRTVCTPATRLLINIPNTLWRPGFALADAINLRGAHPHSSWLSHRDVHNLLTLANWDIIKTQPRALWPFAAGWFERTINRSIAPLLPWLCVTQFIVARPSLSDGDSETPLPADLKSPHETSVTIVVPARNESGNIEAAITRTPVMGAWTEFIFVEGGSKDDTWEEIQRVQRAYPDVRIKAIQQTGKGKGNAVREGYALAEGDILMILDTDLTMPPEELPKYFHALTSGHCEFANGCRLVYPMDEHAMQFLNMIANKIFGILFSWLMGQHLKDTLCGTKVLRRSDYLKLEANRAYFGDFDPFGDFDLIFGADRMNLKIRDIPIRYRDRTYGSTNINRWSHGWLLLRMVLFAARKLKFV